MVFALRSLTTASLVIPQATRRSFSSFSSRSSSAVAAPLAFLNTFHQQHLDTTLTSNGNNNNNNNNNIIKRKMSSSGAPFSYNTYDSLPPAPTFELTSSDIKEGGTMPLPQLSKAFGVDGGEDVSPQLSWKGFDATKTKSFVVTCYDPDAPTVSGFWHWIVYDIPASVTELSTDAGNTDKSKLPEGAKTVKNDAGFAGFCGAAPPPGHGTHRYIFCVSALPVENLPIDESTTSPAVCNFNMFGAGVVGRAFLTATFGR